MAKIGVIGDADSVMGFKTLGIDTYSATAGEAPQLIHKLAREKYAVIFITERTAKNAKEAIDRYKNVAYPAIIPIPGNYGTTGFGMAKLKSNAEKAIGMDILFSNKEGK
ncbi:MAG: V-type ATP synthase subunit F [Eubacteriales bacterium]